MGIVSGISVGARSTAGALQLFVVMFGGNDDGPGGCQRPSGSREVTGVPESGQGSALLIAELFGWIDGFASGPSGAVDGHDRDDYQSALMAVGAAFVIPVVRV